MLDYTALHTHVCTHTHTLLYNSSCDSVQYSTMLCVRLVYRYSSHGIQCNKVSEVTMPTKCLQMATTLYKINTYIKTKSIHSEAILYQRDYNGHSAYLDSDLLSFCQPQPSATLCNMMHITQSPCQNSQQHVHHKTLHQTLSLTLNLCLHVRHITLRVSGTMVTVQAYASPLALVAVAMA